jgi:hypothetical protein
MGASGAIPPRDRLILKITGGLSLVLSLAAQRKNTPLLLTPINYLLA